MTHAPGTGWKAGMDAASGDCPEAMPQIRLGDLLLDLRYRRVTRPDGDAVLPQRMFDLLLLFVAEPGVLHSRQSLFQRVWSGVVVEDGNLSQSVWMLRRALGEARKHWIRTVARSGYVFDPPVAAEPVAAVSPVAFNNQLPACEEPLPAPGATLRTPRLAHGRLRPGTSSITGRAVRTSAVLAAVLLLAAAGMIGHPFPGTQPPPLSIALVPVQDRNHGPSDAATSLLHAWLEWKLSMLPGVVLMGQADLAANGSHPNVAMILLSSGQVAEVADGVYVQARIHNGANSDWIGLQGTTDRIDELVDAVSKQALQRLLPEHADTNWPELRVDYRGVELHHQGQAARHARQWQRATEIGQALVQHAPAFGLAHWHLMLSQAELGRDRQAHEHLTVARRLLTPLPPTAEHLVQAHRLRLNGEYEAAANAYRPLFQHHPQQTSLALALAHTLHRSGQPKQAQSVLAGIRPSDQPVSVRMDQHLIQSDIELMLGQPDRARSQAEQAQRLAESAGWPHERVQAMLARVAIDLYAGHHLLVDAQLDTIDHHLNDLPDTPQRWRLQSRLADLLARNRRIDDAQVLYRSVLSRLGESGYRRLEAGIRLGLAEIAASRSDWSTATELALVARGLIAVQDWHLTSRLHLLESTLQHGQGEIQSAHEQLARLRTQASERGDVLVQLFTLTTSHTLFTGTDDAALRNLAEQTGLHGADQTWRLPDHDQPRQLAVLPPHQHHCISDD